MYLFETMRAEGGEIPLWPRHLDRLMRSARSLGWRIAPPHLPEVLADEVIRLQVGRDGEQHVSRRALPVMGGTYRVGVSPVRVDPANPWLFHKSSHREAYEAAAEWAAAHGLDDALLLNAAGRITESTIASVIVEQGGKWLTPPVSEGLLPGVLRSVLLAEDRLIEKPLDAADLQEATAFYLCNAVRGVFRATLVLPT